MGSLLTEAVRIRLLVKKYSSFKNLNNKSEVKYIR